MLVPSLATASCLVRRLTSALVPAGSPGTLPGRITARRRGRRNRRSAETERRTGETKPESPRREARLGVRFARLSSPSASILAAGPRRARVFCFGGLGFPRPGESPPLISRASDTLFFLGFGKKVQHHQTCATSERLVAADALRPLISLGRGTGKGRRAHPRTHSRARRLGEESQIRQGRCRTTAQQQETAQAS